MDVAPRPTIGRGAVTRGVRLIIGAVLLALATESAYDLFVAFGASRGGGVELSGIQVILAVAIAVTGLGLIQQAVIRAPRPAIVTYCLSLFGYGWLIGVVLGGVIALARRTPPTYDSALVVALAVFSWVVVTLILAVPGLIAVLVARRL
jgi:hypothetical protein